MLLSARVPISDVNIFVYSRIYIKRCLVSFVSRIFPQCDLLRLSQILNRVASLVSLQEIILGGETVIKNDCLLERKKCKLACSFQK